MACIALAAWTCTAVSTEEDVQADPAALTAQALAFEHGEGVGKDPLKAAELYCEAARQGDVEAQFNLGWMYAHGRGLPRDDAMAALLFGMAAKQGHPQAQTLLRFVGEPAEKLFCDKTAKDEPGEELASASPERRKIVQLVADLAPEYGVSAKLALAVIGAESAFNAGARSPKNAQGLMQLIPETALRFNVKNTFDPVQNIRGGLAYLRWLLAYFKGNVALVAAGYNAGEGAVDKYRGIPPYQETQGYVKIILGLFKQDEHPYNASIAAPSPVMDRIQAAKRY